MTTRSQEINALVVEMQTYVTMGDWDNVEATNHRIESLCREDLDEMFGFVVTVPGTVYEFWTKQVGVNNILGGTPVNPKHIPNRLTGESELYRWNQTRKQPCDSWLMNKDQYAANLNVHRSRAAELGLVHDADVLDQHIKSLSEVDEKKFAEWKDKHSREIFPIIIRVTNRLRDKGIIQMEMSPLLNNQTFDARRAQWVASQTMTRGNMIEQLELWRLEAVELGIGMCALKLMEAKEDLVALGEPELPAQANNIVRDCLMRMAEKKSQNIMAGRYGTRAVLRNEQPTGRLRDGCKNEKYHDKPLMDLSEFREGIRHISELQVESYFKPTKPEGYRVTFSTNQTAMEQLNAQKLRTKTFVNIVPQEHAVRMVNDLQHLINITDDDAYAEALSNELRRLSLFANGDVKSITDINFAWTYHE